MKKFFSAYKIILLGAAALGAALPITGLAYRLSVPLPCLPGGVSGPCSSGYLAPSGPAEYILTIYNLALGLGALLAMVMIVIGAVQYTVSEAVASKDDARDRIMSAVWGLVLLIGATLILYTINPQLPELQEPGLRTAAVPPGPPPPPPVCGNGRIEPPEVCETNWDCSILTNICSGCQCVRDVLFIPFY